MGYLWTANMISEERDLVKLSSMDREPVCPTDICVYLGVTMNSKLRWNEHIDKISGAANCLLGFLWRSLNRCPQLLKEKSYKAIVRPKLEYCSCIWDPHHQKYVDQLEMVQRRAARFVKSVPHRSTKPPTSVSAMVCDSGWDMAGWTCFSTSFEAWLNSLRSTIQFHGISQQLEVIPGNSSDFSRL